MANEQFKSIVDKIKPLMEILSKSLFLLLYTWSTLQTWLKHKHHLTLAWVDSATSPEDLPRATLSPE